MQKRFVLILSLTVCLVLFLSGVALAAGFSDTRGHWAGEQIDRWSDKGLAGGYADGTFKPNQQVSRVEFVVLTNRAFNIGNKEAAAGFDDVKSGDWYYNDVAAAKAAGYIGGYTDGTFKPNSPITRQEVAGILVRLLDLAPAAEGIGAFTDAAKISDWSRGSIGVVAKNGLMRGMPDNTFRPLKSITRAEAVVSLDRALEYASAGQEPVETQPLVKSAIEGKVTLNDQGIKNAVVRVFNAGGYEVLDDVRTGNDGYYKLELKPGYYDVTASTEKEIAYQSNIKVTANKAATTDLNLEKAAVISGILKDSNKKIIKNATLVFTTNPTFIAVTNNRGEYTVPVSPDRTYTVRAYDPGSENKNPVIVTDNLSVGKEGQHDLGSQEVSFSDATSSPVGGGGVSTGDTTAPVLDSVQYTLNGQSYTINKNSGNSYNINIPNLSDNDLSKLKIIVNEKSQTSLQVTDTDINSINVAELIDAVDLDELKPVNGKITIDLDSIAILLKLVDFSNYSVGTRKYIKFKLTDASGNSSDFKVVVNVVSA